MRIQKALILAETIAGLPLEEISPTIDQMRRARTLSETVHALNMLLDHPDHRPVAVAALENLGMWVPERQRH